MLTIQAITCPDCSIQINKDTAKFRKKFQCTVCNKIYPTKKAAQRCEARGKDPIAFTIGTPMASYLYEGKVNKKAALCVGKVVGHTWGNSGHTLEAYNVELIDGTELLSVPPGQAAANVTLATFMGTHNNLRLP